ncbi:MAG: alternative ribosome rescue aminoacyl-tRNA hydrolase ArfB [Candidatus Babeliales bacterium]|jgi:ribosome-associated protein
MKNDLHVKNGITIPSHELVITTSRAGGPGGQHVNRTDTRITVRWNVPNTTALTPEQQMRVLQNLQSRLTSDGDIIVHNSESRSQQHNKDAALEQLAHEICRALYVPKVRMKTRVSKAKKEARLREKSRRGEIKKTRGQKYYE